MTPNKVCMKEASPAELPRNSDRSSHYFFATVLAIGSIIFAIIVLMVVLNALTIYLSLLLFS